jgi:hypothetical protein
VLGKPVPACWSKVVAPAESSYQIWQTSPDRSAALLVHGRFDRAATEACLTQALRVLKRPAQKRPARITREGRLTQMVDDEKGTAWLGWSAEWVIWHHERASVEELLAALEKGTVKVWPLTEPLRRVNPATEMWFASTFDVTGRLLGVPSRSAVGWLTAGPGGMTLPVAFEFKSPADAERAAKALEAKRKDQSLPAALRAALEKAKVSQQRHFLTIELDPAVWLTPDTMEAVGAAVGKP